MSKKADPLDLTEFLVGWTPQPKLKRIEKPIEVIYYWTYYKCQCGAEHSCPTYGETPLAKFAVQKLKYNRYVDAGFVYYPLPCAGADHLLPRSIEATEIHIDVCDKCLQEPHVSFFDKPKELPVMTSEQQAVDLLLFENVMESTEVNLDIIEDAVKDLGEIGLFVDKETN